MPAFRKDLHSIGTYLPGKPIEEVMRKYGVTDIVKIASNECPQEPFAPVQDVIAHAASQAHRYPDSAAHDLTRAIAAHLEVEPSNVWVGPGSSSILASIALAMGGEGTTAVYSDQSFILYTIITAMAHSTAVTVHLDEEMRLNAPDLAAAVRPDTTVLYVCNPNNPTGTYIGPEAVTGIIESVPSDVLVVVDEAYEEYVTDPRHTSAMPHALARDNVIVTRTFSKIYGLAGLRVGYAVGSAETISELRRLQLPFATTHLSLVAAEEALRHQDAVAARAKANAAGRDHLTAVVRGLGIKCLESHTNFILIRPPGDAGALAEELLHRGVIVRRFGELIRVTVGTEHENTRFLGTLEDLL
ncbi:MAG: histidinol-phosphate transaminase [bacterium]|nr:histidinol-phosphate transaminase [bacterium]